VTNNKNVHIISATSFLSGIYLGMLGVIWQPLVLSLGASMSLLGFLESLGGRHGLVTNLIQPLGGWLSDYGGRKPLVALGSVIAILAMSLDLLALGLRDWRLLIPATTLLGMVGLSRPARNSLTAESVQASKRGMAYSAVMFFLILPGIFAPALGGFLAHLWGYGIILVSAVTLEGICLALVFYFLRETISRPTDPATWRDLARALTRMVVPPRGFKGFYLAMAGDMFVWGLGPVILFGLLTRTYGFTTAQLGIMSSLFALSWTISQLPLGKLMDRYGYKPFLILSEIIGLLVIGMWLAFSSLEAFAASYLLYGLVAATWGPAMLALLANSVSDEERAQAMGTIFAFRGLVAFPAPYIGGLLFDLAGFRAPLFASFLGVMAVTAAIALLVREPPREVWT